MIIYIIFFSIVALMIMFASEGWDIIQQKINPPETWGEWASKHPNNCVCDICEINEGIRESEAVVNHPDGCTCQYCIGRTIKALTDDIKFELSELKKKDD